MIYVEQSFRWKFDNSSPVDTHISPKCIPEDELYSKVLPEVTMHANEIRTDLRLKFKDIYQIEVKELYELPFLFALQRCKDMDYSLQSMKTYLLEDVSTKTVKSAFHLVPCPFDYALMVHEHLRTILEKRYTDATFLDRCMRCIRDTPKHYVERTIAVEIDIYHDHIKQEILNKFEKTLFFINQSMREYCVEDAFRYFLASEKSSLGDWLDRWMMEWCLTHSTIVDAPMDADVAVEMIYLRDFNLENGHRYAEELAGIMCTYTANVYSHLDDGVLCPDSDPSPEMVMDSLTNNIHVETFHNLFHVTCATLAATSIVCKMYSQMWGVAFHKALFEVLMKRKTLFPNKPRLVYLLGIVYHDYNKILVDYEIEFLNL